MLSCHHSHIHNVVHITVYYSIWQTSSKFTLMSPYIYSKSVQIGFPFYILQILPSTFLFMLCYFNKAHMSRNVPLPLQMTASHSQPHSLFNIQSKKSNNLIAAFPPPGAYIKAKYKGRERLLSLAGIGGERLLSIVQAGAHLFTSSHL